LLTGKVSLKYVDQIKYLIQQDYPSPALHITDSIVVNKNTNDTIDFIVKSLK